MLLRSKYCVNYHLIKWYNPNVNRMGCLCREFRLLSYWAQWLLIGRPFLGLGVFCEYFFVSCWGDQCWLDITFFQYSRARVFYKMKISLTHNVSHTWFFWKLSEHVYFILFIWTKPSSYQFSQVWFVQYPPVVHNGQILEYPTGYPNEAYLINEMKKA
jgi:hypothetical protein